MLSGNNSQNKTRNIILILAALFALLLSGCGAQKPKQVGVLALAPFAGMVDGFKAGMADLGYVEGKNIVYDVQKVADEAEMQKALDKFVADKVDLIFALPTESALLAKAKTQGTNIPVVFDMAFIEGTGLVESVRQPGGNITGVRFYGPDLLYPKFLEVLLELAPNAKRIGLFYDPKSPVITGALEALRPAASSAGVTLVETHIASVADFEADLQARAKASDVGFDAIIIVPDVIVVTPDGMAAVGKFAVEHKLPVLGGIPRSPVAVITLIADDMEMGKLAAPLADKILKGAPAGEIPVVSPDIKLRLNYKLAQELGLTVPEGLLKQAVEIIR